MWIKSAEFAVKFGLNKKSLEKSCFRATKANKKICKVKSHILAFYYTQGIGRGGQVLQIWDEGFDSEAEAVAFLGRGSQNGGVSAAVDCHASPRGSLAMTGESAGALAQNGVNFSKKTAAVCVDSSLDGADEDSNLIVAVSKNLHKQALDSFDSGKNEIATAPLSLNLTTHPQSRCAREGAFSGSAALAVVDIIPTPNLAHPNPLRKGGGFIGCATRKQGGFAFGKLHNARRGGFSVGKFIKNSAIFLPPF